MVRWQIIRHKNDLRSLDTNVSYLTFICSPKENYQFLPINKENLLEFQNLSFFCHGI